MGADAVLVNTALAEARDPVRMAAAFRKAVEAGREAHLAGRMPVRAQASPSSPVAGVVRLPDPEVPA
jgi:thiazole synthase